MSTFCACCHYSLAPYENEMPFEVKNFISIIAEAVGVSHKDTYKSYGACRDLKQILAIAGEYIKKSGFSKEEIARILPEYFHHLTL